MHIKRIYNSVYVHPYIKREDMDLLQWLSLAIPPDKCLGFFRYPGVSQDNNPLSLLGQGGTEGNLTFVTLDSNSKNNTKELIPFYCSKDEEYFAFFKNKKGFFKFSDFYYSHTSKYPLLNLMTEEPQGLYSLDQLNDIKDHINTYGLLDNPLARKNALIQKNEDLNSIKFGSIKNIAVYKDKGICLIRTENPLLPSIGDGFYILSDKQLCLLQSCIPFVQEHTYSFKLSLTRKRKREEETVEIEHSPKKIRIESTEIIDAKTDAKEEISKADISNIKL